MHNIEFDDSVHNDDNRSAEGRELRFEFIDDTQDLGEFDPEEWDFISSPATLFEVLVALCRRLDFQAELGVSNWYYVLIQNLGLKQYADNDVASSQKGSITRKLNKLNNRTYSADGRGGLFPLKDPPNDQRTVELWYQMSYYILENDLIQ